jgi:hypothetical protein
MTATLIGIAGIVNRFGQSVCEPRTEELRIDSRAAVNSTFASGLISFSANSFVVKASAVLRHEN